MRRHVLAAAATAAAILLAGWGVYAGSRAAGAPPAAASTAHGPRAVTLADDGRTVTLPVGASFLLDLGGPPPDAWQVRVDRAAVLGRVPNVTVIRGAQGIYRALAPGRTELTAQPTCSRAGPSCPVAGRLFRVTVVVTAR
jgi:hypothetical protein